MLFTFPSQYWFTIGLLVVFSLAGWSPRIQTGFLVSRPTQDTSNSTWIYVYGNITLYVMTFQPIPLDHESYVEVLQPRHCRNNTGLGSFHFARHYSGNRYFFLFLRILRCFSSPRWLSSLSDRPSACQVVPFGYVRIKSCLQIPAHFRSLPRPSSPPEAKASSVRPL